jgi:predicted O-linked N-acetylglucosamine transferase (SPINDLY family)
MDDQHFVTQLPSLYHHWGQATVQPTNPQFAGVLSRVEGMTTANLLQLLNWAVTCLEPGEAYCEVGCWQGASLIGALLYQDDRLAYAVDNFSHHDPQATNLSTLTENLLQFGVDEQVLFCYQDFQEFFRELAQVEDRQPIGVYHYDAASDYRSLMMGLLMVRPFLAERALIIVSNRNSAAVQQAISDFVQATPACASLLDLPTQNLADPTFGNGVHVLGWNRPQTNSSPQRPVLPRQESFVKAIQASALQVSLQKLEQIKSQTAAAIAHLELKKRKQQPETLAEFTQLVSTALERYQPILRQFPHLDLTSELGAIALSSYLDLANLSRDLGQEELAAEVCRQALVRFPGYEPLHMFRITALQNAGQTARAIEAAQEAGRQFSGNIPWQFEQWRTFPILYDSPTEIDTYRERFSRGLEELVKQPLDTPAAQQAALLGLWWRTNFYLQYQCRDDRALQTRYGEYAHRVMAANYPQWAQITPPPHPASPSPPTPRSKIRVGFVSAHLRHHNGARWALGWIQHLNRQEFDVYCYHIGQTIDEVTHQFQAHSDRFYHIPNDLEAVCDQIQKDHLAILVFPDIGMDPLTTQIAALRLAPVQCTAWGHPVTSGLPTIDYYLSSDLMEPENAQEHYSETLVRLPNTGLCYSPPEVPPLTSSRSDYGLREEAIVYLSTQSLFKYLPQYDHLYAEIARQVPQAQFAFIGLNNPRVDEQFRQRLQRAFAAVGLDSNTYCVILPRQSPTGFLELNQLADVLLDNLGWNGGNTVFEAIACGLPVVTCPTEFMRGRHAYGILKTMGMTEAIAQDTSEYVAIAARLGLNPEDLRHIRQLQRERAATVFNDLSCVRALEEFFRQAVAAI